MATSVEFKDFVLDCVQRAAADAGLGAVFAARRMFGEYCVYALHNGEKKVLFLLCDEQVFVKKLAEFEGFVAGNSQHFGAGLPFDGAREHLIVDVENAAFLGEFLRVALPLLPLWKAKNRRSARDLRSGGANSNLT